jgi:tetratricopeptide (TPR) repeat protein
MIREEALGPDHPDTAVTLDNLGKLYRAKGDYAKAEEFYLRALMIREKARGPDHPDTAMTLDNLAELYRTKGDNAKAEQFHQRALWIREKALGREQLDPTVDKDKPGVQADDEKMTNQATQTGTNQASHASMSLIIQISQNTRGTC